MKRKHIYIGLLLISIFLIITLGVLYLFKEGIENRTGEHISLTETFKVVSTLNYDSEMEKKLKLNFKKHKEGNVSIYYSEDSIEIIPLTIETLNRADEIGNEVFGMYNKKPIDLIFMNIEDIESFSESGNAGYYSDFDKVIGIHIKDIDMVLQRVETPLYFFQKIILHEYTHYAFARKAQDIGLTMDKFPMWFIEGIADFVGNDDTHIGIDYKDPLPLQKLNSPFQWEEARLNKNASPYLQSYFTVNYLIKVNGNNVIKEIMEETQKSNEFYEALEKATKMSVVDTGK